MAKKVAKEKKTVKRSTSKRRGAKPRGKKTGAKRGPQGKRLANWELVTRSSVFGFLKSSKTSVVSLAKTLGVSPAAVYAWKSGRRVPSEEAQQNLAAIVSGSAPIVAKATRTSRKRRKSAFSGSDLRAAREAKKLSRAALAKQLGVSASSLFNWESGKSTPRGKNLEKLRRFAGEAGPAPVPAVQPPSLSPVVVGKEKAQPEAVSGAVQVAVAYLATGKSLTTQEVVAFVRELRYALA